MELEYFKVEDQYGGNQELLHDFWLRLGGCAAVTACDLCIYLDLYRKNETGGRWLYPYDVTHISKKDYEDFAMLMKPYLRPRFGGIDKLSIYTGGFGRYLSDRGFNVSIRDYAEYTEPYECGSEKNSCMTLYEFKRDRSYAEAEQAVRKQLDHGIPIPFLNLNHKDKEFADFVWHWFLLGGYEYRDSSNTSANTVDPGTGCNTAAGRLYVKAISYGESVWLDFERLWNSGFEPKGGMVILDFNANSQKMLDK